MERWEVKLVCGLLMFISLLCCFLLPVAVSGFVYRKWTKGKYYLNVLKCFAGGVFLACYLLYMAPEVRLLIDENLLKPNHVTYPIPELVEAGGFFLMIFLERAIASCRHAKPPAQRTDTKDADTVAETSGDTTCDPKSPLLDNGDVTRTRKSYSTCVTGKSREMTSTSGDMHDVTNIESDVYRVNDRSGEESIDAPQSLLGSHDVTMAKDYVTKENGTFGETKAVIFYFIMSLDSVFDGMAIGLQRSTHQTLAIVIGIITHEIVITFCLGLQVNSIVNGKLKPMIVFGFFYSLMNPLGVLITAILYETRETSPGLELANGVVQGLAAGVFIYVTFYECLEEQIDSKTPWAKLFAILAGFGVLAVFAAVPVIWDRLRTKTA